MDFGVFDNLECYCGEPQLSLHNGASVRIHCDDRVTEVRCKRVCGFKNCRIEAGNVKPSDCAECRRQSIVGGTIRCRCTKEWQIVEGFPLFSSRQLPCPTGADLNVVETDFKSDPRWIPFVANHHEGGVYHHPRWLRALEEEYNQKFVCLACEDNNGRLQGILPLSYTRGLPFGIGGPLTSRRLASLPRTPSVGPLSVSHQATIALMREAVRRVQDERGLELQVKSASANLEEEVAGLTRVDWLPSYVLTLPEKQGTLRFGNARQQHRIVSAVKRAASLGVTVRSAQAEGELEAWYELYLETMRRNAVPPRPKRFFRSLWENLRPHGLVNMILAEREENKCKRLIAGSIFLTFGKTVFYAFTGCKEKDHSLHPNDLIQWQAIHDALASGFRRYDFGEVQEEHQELARFKEKWGAVQEARYRYYYPSVPNLGSMRATLERWGRPLTRAVWQRLPLNATEFAGYMIYSRL